MAHSPHNPKVSIGAHRVRAIAVASHTDPRSVRSVLLGKRVRGDAYDRIIAALTAHGIPVPAAA